MPKAKSVLAMMTFAGLCIAGGEAVAQDTLGAALQAIQDVWSGKARHALAYEVNLSVSGDGDAVEDALKEASALVAQSEQGVHDKAALLALAREDPTRLTAVLYTQGYYSGRVEIRVAGQPVTDMSRDLDISSDGPVPVAISVEPGPLFHFGDIDISYSNSEPVRDTGVDLAREAGLASGEPAHSQAVLDAGNRIVAYWKRRGHAFARVVTRSVTANHGTKQINVAFVVDAGRPAAFGDVEVKGAERFETELVRSRADILTGAAYSPETLKAARKRLAKLEGLRGIRVIEGEEADSEGRMPITIEVSERKPRYFGANAAISSVDGAEVGAYWGHRNIFGAGETFRVDALVSNLGSDAVDNLEYQGKVSLTRPSIASAYTDYKAVFSIEHEEPESYESDEAKLSVGVAHQFSSVLNGELAVQGRWIATEDALGTREFFLVSLPSEIVYDSRDNPLDASRGWRASLFAEPAADLKNEAAYIETRSQLSAYKQMGGSPQIVAAARVGVGTIAGADLEDVPANTRFLGGGGGSVRGYAYRSVGPELDGEIIGGLSFLEFMGELRIKVSDQVGIVPFVDAALVTSDSFFGGQNEMIAGAGLGLRYYTPIGPVRLDVATPLDRLSDEPEVVFYVGLGQAF